MMVRKIALLLLAGLCVSACSNDTHKIGSTVKGTRVAILEKTKSAEADPALQGQKPQLSEPVANTSWPQAGYDTTHVMPNADAGAHLAEMWRADIGSGSDSDFKLLARPVVADSHVFAMDAQGIVVALDAKSGEQ